MVRIPTQLARALLCLALVALAPAGSEDELSPLRLALERAERSLQAGDLDGARVMIQRALERDRKSTDAWDLRARWGQALGDRDEQVYSRHQEYRLALAQGLSRSKVSALLEALEELDPLARELYGMKARFLKKLLPVAKRYEVGRRPHSAIRVYKQILALDPESAEAQAAIERIAASPDPSLAGDAKPKDLFADVSAEWIAEFDAQHGEWSERAKLERENYITYTDAGYVVLVRTGEAMEQMNAFYRLFFRHGTEEHGGSVPRIAVHIFKNRDEYLTLGIGPPVEWTGGHFTGSAVETYIDQSFAGTVGTLFHEAAHQFVSLATNAVGWLNEGLASFFEGTRVLPNGTVIMNMPANDSLFPLAERMERGWMADESDGFDPSNSDSVPEKAPTFRIVIENRYSWGPPWYAPTWGLVYFLYNYQDPVDGRHVYRDAFMEFVDKSGGKMGNTAIKTFEKVVLAEPKPELDVERPEGSRPVALPQTVDEVDAVWKEWILDLRDEQQGIVEVERPYAQWGRYAAASKDYVTASEHFEKGLVADPTDIDLLLEFADLLDEHFDNADRATKLALEALHFLEQAEERDEDAIDDVERLLGKLDPKRRTLTGVLDEMAAAARGIVERYSAAGLDLMVMDVTWRAASDLQLDDLYELYVDAVRRSGKSLAIWQLAYNEQNLDGWASGVQSFRADGTAMASSFGTFAEDRYDFQFLTLDRVTSGDFSMEAEIQAEKGEVNFCGFVFGQKDATNFHALLLFPGKTVAEGGAQTGYLDLVTSYGVMKTWLHVPVQTTPEPDPTRTVSEIWHELRLDVTGRDVDIWFDGELVGTREFPSRDVLYGSFGLITGPGTARYRDVRFLARDAADPAAALERGMRIEKLEAETGGAPGGSYQGKRPPFPKVSSWVQGERTDWDEVGPVPQLLVFWSIQQNDLVRIDEWLQDLARQYAGFGLEIVSVCSTHDGPKLDEYLAEKPFPGSLALDFLGEGEVGIGDSFERFFIRRFNLPRLLLLDLDRRVVWEGDPGFEIGVEPSPPYDTFLSAPLDDLIARRKLVELQRWRRRWENRVRPALHDGDFEGALEHLRQAGQFEPRYAPEAGRAASSLRAVQAAIADLQGAGEALAQQGAEPALALLVKWAQESFGVKLGSKQKRALKVHRGSKPATDWKKAAEACKRFAKRRGETSEKAAGLIEDLARRQGALVETLRADLSDAAEARDWSAFERVVADAERMPRLWLCREYFGW